jgi:hypothetical protein
VDRFSGGGIIPPLHLILFSGCTACGARISGASGVAHAGWRSPRIALGRHGAVAAQSFFSIALTCEDPRKPGPLRFAAEHGGKVLYLPNLDQSGQSLKAYIAAFHGA